VAPPATGQPDHGVVRPGLGIASEPLGHRCGWAGKGDANLVERSPVGVGDAGRKLRLRRGTRLTRDGAAVTGSRARDGNPTRRVLAQLAEAATNLLTDPSVRRIRQCEGPHCRLLFLPAHPRRRWCSPASCGNRVHVARYYRRHRDDPAPGRAAGPSRPNRRRRP
jgi:hypothetical protein